MLAQCDALSEGPPCLDFEQDALFLDLDGTLVELGDRPENIVMEDEFCRTLRDIEQSMSGAVAIVTGRTINDAHRVIQGAVGCIGGQHGFEYRLGHEDESRRDESVYQKIKPLVAELRPQLARRKLAVHVEDKQASIALHYRSNAAQKEEVIAFAEELANQHGLRILHGKMVVEIVAGIHNKGDIIELFMNRSPFAGRRPVAVGDDITDEDAFAYVNGLEGVSILVGASRLTKAQYRLPDVSALRNWLLAGFAAGGRSA